VKRILAGLVLAIIFLALAVACTHTTNGQRPSEGGTQDCTPGYSPCLPPAADYDCAGGIGDGPEYVSGPVTVTGSDPYGLDYDNSGVGCE
jgi:hypothetical protein